MAGRQTRVLAEQTTTVDRQQVAGRLTIEELQQVDAALRVVLGL